MGIRDTVEKEYLSDNEKFADVVNAFFFEGKQVIHPEDLEERDTTEDYTDLINSKMIAEQRVRDVVKLVSIKQYRKVYLAIIGIENQTELHYAIAVRNMLYEALNYASQVKAAGNFHQHRPRNKGEFTSGFRKEDTIIPVVTIVVYWGSGLWSAPRSLFDMFPKNTPDFVKDMISNYTANILVPEEIQDMNIFKTDVRQVLKAVRAADSRQALEELIATDPGYLSVDRESAIAIMTFTGMNLKMPSGKEVNMCKAVEEMERDWTAKGKAEGRAEGKAEGKAEGIIIGEGNGKLLAIYDMVQSGDITPERAVERARGYGYSNIDTLEDIRKRIHQVKQHS